MPSELRRLAEVVQDIPAAVDDPMHGKIVAALSLLANLLRVDDPEAATKIDKLASKLMRSPPHERGHADLARQALGIALDAYARAFPKKPKPELRDAYVDARRAHARISGAEPLRFQLHEVAATLRSLANIAALDRGLPAFFTPSPGDADVGYAPGELRRRALRASELVAALGAEREWTVAGAKAARALDAFADAIEVSPLQLDVAAWRSLVHAIRYEALQLEREGDISLDRSDHVKVGLAASVSALHALQEGRTIRILDLLAKNADTAVQRIDEHTTFVFQRAIIQEAFRTIADALLVVSEDRVPSSQSASRE